MLLWPNMARMEYLVPLVVLLLFGALGGYVIINGGQLIPTDGDDQPDDENEQNVPDWNVYYVAEGSNLPDCDATTLGRLYYVEAESAFYVCNSDGWMFIDLTGAQGEPGQAGDNGTWTPGRKNIPPTINLVSGSAMEGTPTYSPVSGELLGYSEYNISLYREVADLDGNIISAGWDFDLDGRIDHNSTDFRTVDQLSIPSEHWMDASTVYPDGYPFNFGELDDYQIATIAFLATDDDGATSPELVTIHNVFFWLYEEEAGDNDTTGNTLNTYSANDANGGVSSGTGDALIMMQMTGQDTLSWTFTSIRLSVGDTVHKCTVGGGDACTISQQGGDNGNAWEPGEFIFLSESGTDICSDVGCNVGISVTYNGNTVAGDGSVVVD